MQEVKKALSELDDRSEHLLIVQQYTDDLLSYKDDLRKVNDELLKLDLEDAHELVALQAQLKMNVSVRQRPSQTSSRKQGPPLPAMCQLSYPSWKCPPSMWKSYLAHLLGHVSSEHSQTGTMSSAEKRQAVSGGPTAQVMRVYLIPAINMKRLSPVFEIAIQPQLVHEAYMKAIVEYSKLKDGSGRE